MHVGEISPSFSMSSLLRSPRDLFHVMGEISLIINDINLKDNETMRR